MVLDPIQGDKFTPRYEGPYTVVCKNTGGAYILKDGTGALLGRRYAPSQLKLALNSLTEPTYKVEEILDARSIPEKEGVPAHTEYLVKWKDYESEFNTWEPEKNFIEKRCIHKFWKDCDLSNSTLLTQTRLLAEKDKTMHLRQGATEYNEIHVLTNTNRRSNRNKSIHKSVSKNTVNRSTKSRRVKRH
jgi:hypothetical protein